MISEYTMMKDEKARESTELKGKADVEFLVPPGLPIR
jgi:hypothetical protein